MGFMVGQSKGKAVQTKFKTVFKFVKAQKRNNQRVLPRGLFLL